MEENNNVHQLSVALNQLLNAYENLQKERKELITKLKVAENKNMQLDNKLNSLSNVSSQQSNEMGDMLNRIETILSSPLEVKQNTPIQTLTKAYDIAKSYGLKYVYIGNVGATNNTICPKCNELLVSRKYFNTEFNIIQNNSCPKCGNKIYGIWS